MTRVDNDVTEEVCKPLSFVLYIFNCHFTQFPFYDTLVLYVPIHLESEWLEQASLWHEIYCHDLEVMTSNPAWVELGVCSASV